MTRALLAATLSLTLAGGCAFSADAKAPDTRSEKQLLRDLGAELPDERLDAARALAAKGPGVVPKLIEALGHKDWKVRRAATDALAELKADAKPAVPALVKALGDKDAWVRAGAAVALGRIGAEAKDAAPALAKAAADSDVWVRKAALESLGRGGLTDDKELLLRAALGAMAIRESGWAAKRFAMDIINKHGKQHKPAIPVLLKTLEHPPQGMWNGLPRCVELLKGMGAAEKCVPLLIRLCDPKLRGEARTAASALGTFGKVAAPALPALKNLREKTTDKGARQNAEKAIAAIEAALKK